MLESTLVPMLFSTSETETLLVARSTRGGGVFTWQVCQYKDLWEVKTGGETKGFFPNREDAAKRVAWDLKPLTRLEAA